MAEPTISDREQEKIEEQLRAIIRLLYAHQMSYEQVCIFGRWLRGRRVSGLPELHCLLAEWLEAGGTLDQFMAVVEAPRQTKQ